MKRQRKCLKWKNKTPEKELHKQETNNGGNVQNADFKVAQGLSENFDKKTISIKKGTEIIKKNQSEMKNTPEEINSILD